MYHNKRKFVQNLCRHMFIRALPLFQRRNETTVLPTHSLFGKPEGEDEKRKDCPTDRLALLIRWKPERVDGKRKACPANRLAFVGNPRENSGNERTANRRTHFRWKTPGGRWKTKDLSNRPTALVGKPEREDGKRRDCPTV